MAKIAVELERALTHRAVHGMRGSISARLLAKEDGWSVTDMVCTFGPRDRSFEERHSQVSIAIVAAGSFQYRSAAGLELMTPGSLLLGNVDQCFECGHEHGAGDRCLAFQYSPAYFEDLVGKDSTSAFRALRLPPLAALSPLIARACAGTSGCAHVSWEELSVCLAGQAVHIAGEHSSNLRGASLASVARVTRTIRMIDRHPEAELTLSALAREAGLSRYHFLRVFEGITGLTPHRYVLRSRLRESAIRLTADPERVLDIALDCGFGDVSSFNRAFRAEFGLSPRAYRNTFVT